MGILDSIFGRNDDQTNQQRQAPQPVRPQNADEQAVARYRYMLQSAPPEQLEAAHAEAFARLTPEQRQLALQSMAQAVPENERNQLSDDPQSLARAATRAEIRQPGTIERLFGGQQNRGAMGGGSMGGGMMGGMGGMLAGGLLSSMAGAFIGTSIANSFFSHSGVEQAFQSSPEAQSVDGGVDSYDQSAFQDNGLDADSNAANDSGSQDGNFDQTGSDVGADPYGDPGLDNGGGFDTVDTGLDSGGFDGGDFGGGDFGGGDF